MNYSKSNKNTRNQLTVSISITQEIHIESKHAKGPLYARHVIQKNLYKNEDYYLQIDSHMRFEKNWDETVIEQLTLAENMNDTKKASKLIFKIMK
jgi:hypothetical protein